MKKWLIAYEDSSIAASWANFVLDDSWTCDKCTVCLGCDKKDIVSGVQPHPPPPTLSLEKVCTEKIFPELAKAATPTSYTKLLQDEYDQAEREVVMEMERVQEDENSEKKDLVGGAEG